MEWLRKIRQGWAESRVNALLASSTGPLELGVFSRSIVLAVVLGIVAGLVGAAFNALTDEVRQLLLVDLAGARLMHAAGEPGPASGTLSRMPWLLLVLPAAGALLGGLLTRWAPEAYGGGSDRAIADYHSGDAAPPLRLLPVKFLASVATLASGGAGGREGPSMQLGSIVGATLSRWFPMTPREQRTLYVAGIGAGMSAVFQTPLGAAILATEVLYRDDFEADALVPSVLASVVSYSVSYTLLGTRAFFGHLPPHPFQVGHLPLYVLLAIAMAACGAFFVWALHEVHRVAAGSRFPRWATPALGGLGLGALIAGFHLLGRSAIGGVPVESAILGSGYGVAQWALVALTRPSLALAGLLLFLALLRMLAAAFTVGSGGSAGDFAPSISAGALLGAAFGHVAGTIFPGAGIQPASFAFVGMAAMYGGIAHAPLGAMILVSELAGTYDLLVPLMVGTVGTHLLLKNVQLYPSQAAHRTPVTPR